MILGSAMLAACSETPREQLDLAMTVVPDMSMETVLDLSGAVPTADLKVPPPTLTNVTPNLLTTAGGQVTLTGTNFSTGTEFFVNNLLVNFSLTNSTTAVLTVPQMLGQIGPVTVTVRNPNGAQVANSNTTGSATALTFAASHVQFTLHDAYATETGTNPKAVAIADVNNDGKPDIVSGQNAGGTYDILLGDGKGDFARGITSTGVQNSSFATKSSQLPLALFLVDINADTYPDIIMGTTSSTVQYLLNGGATNPGIFTATQETYTEVSPVQSVAVADYNKDGFPDIAFANTVANTVGGTAVTTGTIGIIYGGQTGNTAANLYPVAATTLSITNSVTRLVESDVNKDGFPDIVFVGQANNAYTLNVLIGTGTGTTISTTFTFPTPGGYGTNSANQFPQWVEVADLNNDGNPDAVVSDNNAADVRVFLGNGTSTNTFQTPVAYPVNDNPVQVSIADVNGDGIPDLVVANSNILTNSLTVLLGKGDGTFPTRLEIPSTNSPYQVLIQDLNGDGLKDLVVTNQNSPTNATPGNIAVFFNTSQ